MVSLQSINIRSLFSMLSKAAVVCILAVILFPIDAQAQADDLDVISYHAQDGPRVIQDNGGYDGRTVWEINLTGAPDDAVIRSVDIEYWITHEWVGDLKVWLATEDKGEWVEYVLWDRESGNANDIHEEETGLSAWNGLLVNRKWYLSAADYVNMDEGRIDSWKIWVYFDKVGEIPQFVPYYEDFTEGKPDNSRGWEYYSNNRGRIEVVEGKLRMDNEQSGFSYSLNEAILHLDLSGRSGVTLTLGHENDSDENTSLPSRFTGHLNGDGIAISPDGLNWYLVTNLTSSFSQKSFDLDPIVQEAGISYTSDFRIKFQQYDNYEWPTDGRAFDNISITATGADPQARTPFGLWNGTFNSTTYGVTGNINDWIMREDYTTQAVWELTVVPGTGIKINPSGTFSFNPLNDSLDFLYTGPASILNDGQTMEVPGTLNVQGTVFRNRIEGNYTLQLSSPNLPPVIDNGTLQVNKEADVSLHVFGIEMSTGWNYNDLDFDFLSEFTYDFSLGLETDDTVSYIEFQTPKGYTFQIPSDSYTQVDDVETWHYPVGTAPSAPSSTPASGLVAHWTMDDNAANTTVTDSSGNGNHGTAVRNTSELSTAGKFDGALTFNGSSDYINCGNDSNLDLTDNFTLAAWIKPRSFSWLAGILSKYHSPNADSYALRLNRDAPYNKLEFGGANMITSSSALNADQWYFIVAMVDSGTGKIYIDGSLDVSSAMQVSPSSDSLYIGIDYKPDARYFDGAIDNVMIFNRTFTEAEISALGSEQQPPVPGSREGWDYKGMFASLDEFDKYSDGTYTIKVYYKDGTKDQTSIRFGIPGTNNFISQPTEKPILTSPKYNSMMTSPVTFKWEPCNDVNATSVSLYLENQDTSEYVDVKPPVGATSSDPIQLSPGVWQAQIFCESWYDANNLDSIDISVGKYSESDYIFNVVDGGSGGGDGGLVAHWTMDDNAANTTVTDSSGNGNNGTARRNTSELSTPGKINGALTFNGSSDYINCGNNSSLDLTDNFTIAAWIKPRSFSWLAGILSKYHSPNADSYALRLNRDAPYNKLEFGGANMITSSSALNADQWYFIVAMVDSGTGKIYIDGSLDVSSAMQVSPSSDSLYIGIDYKPDARYFDGAIDNVMIFNRKLSGAEIDTLYNKGDLE